MEIHEGTDFPEADARNAELFFEPADGGFLQDLADPRMRAAGIGPEAAGVVFTQGALLQQNAGLRSVVVIQEDRESPVQHRRPVRGKLLLRSDLLILFVNENDPVFHVKPHISDPCHGTNDSG